MTVPKTPRRTYLPVLLLLTSLGPLSQALGDTATNREVARFAASVQSELGDYDQAASVLEAHVAEDLQDGSAWRILALIQEHRGRTAAARAALNHALALAGSTERQSLETLLAPTATPSPASDPRSTPARPWRFVAPLDAGYDSNVIHLNDATRAGSTDSGGVEPLLLDGKKLSAPAEIPTGARLTTGPNSGCTLLVRQSQVILIGESTQLVLTETWIRDQQSRTTIDVQQGRAR